MTHLIDMARRKAMKSGCMFKVSAIGLDKKGNVLGVVTNAKRLDRYGGGIHAEMNLLHRYGDHVKTIIICRVGGSGNILPIHPCERCKKVLDKLGIKVLRVTE